MKPDHVATQLRLPRKMLEELKIRAAKRRTSLAQLVREALEQTYGLGPHLGVDPKRDPFFSLIGASASGISDGAKRHDRDIYGAGD